MKTEGTFCPDGDKVMETTRAGKVLEPQQVCAACHPAGGEDLQTGVESWREDPPETRRGRGGGHPSTLSPPRSPSLPQHLSSGLSQVNRYEPHRCLLGSEQMEKDGEWIQGLSIFQHL